VLCIFYVHAAGLPGPAAGVPPTAPTPTASRPPPLNLQAQTAFLPQKPGRLLRGGHGVGGGHGAGGERAGGHEELKANMSHASWFAWSDIQQSKSCFKMEGHDKLFTDALRSMECASSAAVFFLMGNLYAVALAVLVDVAWHITHYCFPTKQMNPFLRNLCLGVLVLNIFYNKFLHDFTWPFTASSIMLCFESCIYRGVDALTHRNINDEDLKKLTITNRYQLLSADFSRTFFLFLCQFTLGLFYIYELNNHTGGWQDVSGWRWFIGLLLCNIAGEDEVGSAFDMSFWLTLLKKDGLMDLSTKMFICIPVKYKYEVRARMVGSMIVNMFFRRIIFCTTPVLLGVVNEPLDFVKDCLAVFYITKIDDLDNPIEFSKDLEKVSKELDEHSGFYSLIFADQDDRDQTDTEVHATMADLDATKTDLKTQLDKANAKIDDLDKQIRALQERMV